MTASRFRSTSAPTCRPTRTPPRVFVPAGSTRTRSATRRSASVPVPRRRSDGNFISSGRGGRQRALRLVHGLRRRSGERRQRDVLGAAVRGRQRDHDRVRQAASLVLGSAAAVRQLPLVRDHRQGDRELLRGTTRRRRWRCNFGALYPAALQAIKDADGADRQRWHRCASCSVSRPTAATTTRTAATHRSAYDSGTRGAAIVDNVVVNGWAAANGDFEAANSINNDTAVAGDRRPGSRPGSPRPCTSTRHSVLPGDGLVFNDPCGSLDSPEPPVQPVRQRRSPPAITTRRRRTAVCSARTPRIVSAGSCRRPSTLRRPATVPASTTGWGSTTRSRARPPTTTVQFSLLQRRAGQRDHRDRQLHLDRLAVRTRPASRTATSAGARRVTATSIFFYGRARMLRDLRAQAVVRRAGA